MGVCRVMRVECTLGAQYLWNLGTVGVCRVMRVSGH